MTQLEVFFDYACPYCWQGHQNLMDLLPCFPEIEVVWRPCESHPRPERYGPHSDLLMQGLLFAMENGADLQRYHERGTCGAAPRFAPVGQRLAATEAKRHEPHRRCCGWFRPTAWPGSDWILWKTSA